MNFDHVNYMVQEGRILEHNIETDQVETEKFVTTSQLLLWV